MRISPQSIEFGLWCNGSTTGFGSVCLGSNPGKPTEKEQWKSAALFLFKQFSACHLSNPPLRSYRSSVSSLYFTLQNTGEKCTMYPYTETETPLSILSPCVSVREYRGSVRRTRGLKNTVKKIPCNISQPLSSETNVSSVSPLYFALQNTGEKV